MCSPCGSDLTLHVILRTYSHCATSVTGRRSLDMTAATDDRADRGAHDLRPPAWRAHMGPFACTRGGIYFFPTRPERLRAVWKFNTLRNAALAFRPTSPW